MPRDLSTIVATYGRTSVALTTYRNRQATAFASVVIAGPYQEHTEDAKSQGPSAGGYNKPAQALERLTAKLSLSGVIPKLLCHRPEQWADCIAKIAESARVTGCLPAWRM